LYVNLSWLISEQVGTTAGVNHNASVSSTQQLLQLIGILILIYYIYYCHTMTMADITIKVTNNIIAKSN